MFLLSKTEHFCQKSRTFSFFFFQFKVIRLLNLIFLSNLHCFILKLFFKLMFYCIPKCLKVWLFFCGAKISNDSNTFHILCLSTQTIYWIHSANVCTRLKFLIMSHLCTAN